MTEKEILNLIRNDERMMSILRIADGLNLPNWIIGAGFVRNKVWNHLHNYSNTKVDTSDVDLAYYYPDGNDQISDEMLSQKLKQQTGIDWEVVNQVYAHKWNGVPSYKSTEDALSQWLETATSTGVTLKKGHLKLIAPYGITDLVELIVRPVPKFLGNMEKIRERAEKKKWSEKWPKLQFSSEY